VLARSLRVRGGAEGLASLFVVVRQERRVLVQTVGIGLLDRLGHRPVGAAALLVEL
jgi:hypothetical protein